MLLSMSDTTSFGIPHLTARRISPLRQRMIDFYELCGLSIPLLVDRGSP
ncbi:MAG: hypothetical protein JWO80_3561 [Bryobacterales bacterium]|nr:hypothetical protein [Bryobacterales bacterium]